MSFADLQSRVNASVFAKLANATACDPDRRADSAFGMGDVPGIFENGYSASGLGISGFEASQPSFRCLHAAIPDIKHGDPVLIGTTIYKVSEIEPDGTGCVLLVLKK